MLVILNQLHVIIYSERTVLVLLQNAAKNNAFFAETSFNLRIIIIILQQFDQLMQKK